MLELLDPPMTAKKPSVLDLDAYGLLCLLQGSEEGRTKRSIAQLTGIDPSTLSRLRSTGADNGTTYRALAKLALREGLVRCE